LDSVLLGADHVVVEPADQGAGAGPGEERHRHALHVVEDGGAQVQDEPFADAGGQPARQQPDARLGQRDGGDQQGEPDDGRLLGALGDGVDDTAGEDGRGDGQQRRRDAEHEEERELTPVRPGESGDAAQRLLRERPLVLGGVPGAVDRVPGGSLHAHGREGRTST
jgi:hypothetical protein